ncbi:response regulator transcription factor [Phormidium sp. FACHB-592]|uniref:Response regulator transcription factor n=1 Tax=Stenomitos frigidus AS-A4 TaxID=2933935 RepID=A0ABV0KP07_9CYAN|nr:response regulator transcription factor [Phormidium sp. FACHB-592]MBD2072919.1 response regulator transcription factor [Phormidium sp. FACHB-592]
MYPLTTLAPPLTHPISTLLVDDCFAFCKGLSSLLAFYSTTSTLQFQVVGQATSLEQAIEHAIQQSPMLILLDMDLGQSSGIEVLQQLRSHSKTSHVLVLSAHQEGEWVYRAMQAGAKGYLFKHNLSTQLLEAIQVVMQNQIYLSPEVATSFFHLFHFAGGRSMSGTQTIHLTEREREVLHWLVQGASNEAIAQKLNITVGTVKAYLTTIFEKMQVSSRTQAALQALKLGLVSA